MKTTTDLALLRTGAAFTWGRVIAIHDISRYTIVESMDRTAAPGNCVVGSGPDELRFHVYCDGKETSASDKTLEGALLHAIAVGIHGRPEANNGGYARFAALCLGLRSE